MNTKYSDTVNNPTTEPQSQTTCKDRWQRLIQLSPWTFWTMMFLAVAMLLFSPISSSFAGPELLAQKPLPPINHLAGSPTLSPGTYEQSIRDPQLGLDIRLPAGWRIRFPTRPQHSPQRWQASYANGVSTLACHYLPSIDVDNDSVVHAFVDDYAAEALRQQHGDTIHAHLQTETGATGKQSYRCYTSLESEQSIISARWIADRIVILTTHVKAGDMEDLLADDTSIMESLRFTD